MIEELISYIQVIVAEHGALGVFLATLLEEIIAPIPSPLVPLSAGFLLLPVDGSFLDITQMALFIIALPVAFGIAIGSSIVYSIGYLGGKPAIEKSKKWIGLGWKDVERIENKFTRGNGDKVALFVLRILPIIPGVAISGFCGIVRYPIKTFAVITFFGALVRAFMLGIVGWYAGEVYATYSETISSVEKYIFLTLIAFVVLFIGGTYFVKKARRQTKTS